MSDQSYIQNQVEKQKKVLNDLREKKEKHLKNIWLFALITAILSALFLLVLPAATFEGVNIKWKEVLDTDFNDSIFDSELSSAKTYFILQAILTAICLIWAIYSTLKKEQIENKIIMHIIIAVAFAFTSILMLIGQMSAGVVLSSDGEGDARWLWWAIVFCLNIVYIYKAVIIKVNNKYIAVLLNEIKKTEN